MKIIITGGSGFIGTNLVEHYLDKGVEVLNIDIKPPKINSYHSLWRQLDIRDLSGMQRAFMDFRPDAVMHMAARANLTGKTLEDYSTNTTGVENLCRVSAETPSVRKAVFASTMLVCEVGYQPKHETDYRPTTLYGQSKMVGEQIIRRSAKGFDWAIVRPTSIWGPWFGPTYRGFFDMLMKRRYVNFSGNMSVKTYGYIGNTVYQLDSILASDASNGRTLYIGDYEPTRIKTWAREIAKEFDYRVPTVPRPLIWLAAKLGDWLQKAKIAFPMNSFRFKNMTTDNVLDLRNTAQIAPKTVFSRMEGNRLTIEWIRAHG
jgi:nucleoside-diphosphate-sugar epimerase